MKEILIILACVPFYAANAFCDKLASTKGDRGKRQGTVPCLFYSILAY